MIVPFTTFLGLDYGVALLIVTVIASIGTFGAMVMMVFFAWAPHLSERWGMEFGASSKNTTSPSTGD